MTIGHTSAMKTAISLPDDLFRRAEDLASQLGISRSQLYADALRSYLAWRREEAIREALDAIHEADPAPLDEGLKRAQAKVLRESDW